MSVIDEAGESEKDDELMRMFGGGKPEKKAAYDGELNAMTFNHVKSSRAFDINSARPFSPFDVSLIEEDQKFNDWLNSTTGGSTHKKSEDGWAKKNHSFFTSKSKRQETMAAVNQNKHGVSFSNKDSQLSFGPGHYQ